MLYEFLLSIGLLHWIAAFVSILAFLFVRTWRIINFSWHRWFHENLISGIWSVFILSIIIPLLYIYFPMITIFESALMGYVGTHIIFCGTKPLKIYRKYHIKDPNVL
jgi:hypothetical protein